MQINIYHNTNEIYKSLEISNIIQCRKDAVDSEIISKVESRIYRYEERSQKNEYAKIHHNPYNPTKKSSIL